MNNKTENSDKSYQRTALGQEKESIFTQKKQHVYKLQICAIPESNGIQRETAEISLNLQYKERLSHVSDHKQAEEKLATPHSITGTCLEKIVHYKQHTTNTLKKTATNRNLETLIKHIRREVYKLQQSSFLQRLKHSYGQYRQTVNLHCTY
jgi:hypothetical protein